MIFSQVRYEELKFFLKFLLKNLKYFESDVILKFFDSSIPDTKIGTILGKVVSEDNEILFNKLKSLYPS